MADIEFPISGHLNQENDFHYHDNTASSEDLGIDAMIDKEFRLAEKNSTLGRIAKGAFTLGAGLVMLANSYNCKSEPFVPPINPTGVVQFYFANDLKNSVYSLPIDFDVSGSAKTITLSASSVRDAYPGAIYVWNRSKNSSFVASDKTSGNVNVNVSPSDAMVAVVLNTKSGLNYPVLLARDNQGFDFGLNPICTFENRGDSKHHLDRASSERVIGFISGATPYFKPTLGANGAINFGGGPSGGEAGKHDPSGRAEASFNQAGDKAYAVLSVELIELLTHCSTNSFATTLGLAGMDGKPTPQGADFLCYRVIDYIAQTNAKLPN